MITQKIRIYMYSHRINTHYCKNERLSDAVPMSLKRYTCHKPDTIGFELNLIKIDYNHHERM